MISFKIGGIPYLLPDRWEALTAEQIYQVLPICFGTEPSPTNRLKVIQKLVKKGDKSNVLQMAGARAGYSDGIRIRTIRRLSDQDRFDLLELVRWCWETSLSHCPISCFDFEGIRYHLPEPGFGNATAIEYAMGDIFFRSFVSGKQIGALNKLVATICRPQKKYLDTMDPEWNGDVREKYNAKIVEKRAESFQALELSTKILVLQYFIGSQRQINSQYDIWETPEATGQAPAGQEPIRPTWLMLLMDIAEQGVFGDWDHTCFTPLHTVLFYLANKKAKSLEAVS